MRVRPFWAVCFPDGAVEERSDGTVSIFSARAAARRYIADTTSDEPLHVEKVEVRCATHMTSW
jgi:hypothetical protein